MQNNKKRVILKKIKIKATENSHLFKLGNRIIGDITRTASGQYNCFLKTSRNGGLSCDYPTYNQALLVMCEYAEGVISELFCFDFENVPTI